MKKKKESFELQALRENNKQLSDNYDELFALAVEMAKELELIRDNIQIVASGATIRTRELLNRWRIYKMSKPSVEQLEETALDEKLKQRLKLFPDRTKEAFPTFADTYRMAWRDALDWKDKAAQASSGSNNLIFDVIYENTKLKHELMKCQDKVFEERKILNEQHSALMNIKNEEIEKIKTAQASSGEVEFEWANPDLEKAANADQVTCGVMPHNLDSVQWQKFCSFKHGAKWQHSQMQNVVAGLREENERLRSILAVARMINNQNPDVRMTNQLNRWDEHVTKTK